MENTVLGLFSIGVFGLLILVTGGIIYLTLAEWRDRRRTEEEKRATRRR